MVTGSDGYIARGVIELLLRNGHHVQGLGFTSSGFSHARYSEVTGDAFAYDFSMYDMPEMILHFAWRDGFDYNSLIHLDQLPGHVRFLMSAVDAGIKRIAVMGTMHEVGYHEGMVTEDCPCNPTTPYGVSKNALHQLMVGLARSHGVKLQWLRGFNLVSNDGRGDSIFSKTVHAAQSGCHEFPLTSSKNRYDFLSYDACCSTVVSAITQEEVVSTINICSGESVTIVEYNEQFIAANGFDMKLAYDAYPDLPIDSPDIFGDTSIIHTILLRKGTTL